MINLHEARQNHVMSCVREKDWLVWRCHQCSKKVKVNLITDKVIFERQGMFTAHHKYQCYKPSKEEWNETGFFPVDQNIDFTFT